MKNELRRNLALASVALASLTVYILACTSFSPDDTKVLYPVADPASGAIGLAVYDRESKKSEMVFLPAAYASATNSTSDPTFLRGEWVQKGRGILAAWSHKTESKDDELNLALVPFGRRGTVKLFHLAGLADAGALLSFPLCVASDSLFLSQGSNRVVRLELQTGALKPAEVAGVKGDLLLLPSPDGRRVFYVDRKDSFGWMNPETFVATPLLSFSNNITDGSFLAYDAKGRVGFVQNNGPTNCLQVLRDGKLVFSRPLGSTEQFAFGNAIFSPRGDRLWASFQKAAGTNRVAYGLMEIPLSEAPLLEVVLIPSAPDEGKDSGVPFFQFSMSHDGKTAAVVSTYLTTADHALPPEDYALFLVALDDPKHKVTKVPLAAPRL